MKRNTRNSALAVMAAATFALTACGNDLAGNSPEPSVAQQENWNEGGEVQIAAPDAEQANGVRIAFLGNSRDNPFSEYMFRAVEDEAQRYGATAEFVGPTNFDAQEQYQLVSDIAVGQQYDVILIIPNDSASITPAVEAAAAAGIPTVALNQPIGPDILSDQIQAEGVVSQIVEDLELNATAMADGTIAACENKDPCKVEVLWGVRSLLFDKVKPDIFYAALADHPNIEIVCETDAEYTQDLGRTQAADCLQANPDLNVIASQADESTRGAESSVVAAGRTVGTGPDDVRLVSSYGTMYAIDQIREGHWDMTTYNRPQSTGRAGVRIALSHLQGDEVPEYVRMEHLDGDPFMLTKEVLDANPQIVGQWEG
ncbi:substrate-binding domain-containing protein [Gordonia sp. HNM0687]|uniref:Substrate-binding domain-containing protein n=1 Tax=Gordonia mangrovi TaxID=2665643 RepID=A0A6L7GVE4_9ACTN|nr:sugar ABC transporter substrate-binding protein [Gordonia mangrovi]MXP23452.1 substrate-binding domain-containing protein [Gordonia mangrovi]UVF76652.1 sugar ABC transporter substrate-binding protein [Gordonia mangrovi]